MLPQNTRIRSETRKGMAFVDLDLVRAADAIAKELGGTCPGGTYGLDVSDRICVRANAR